MPDDPKAAAPAPPPVDKADLEKRVGYIGARLREKSTYGGLAVLIGLALPLMIQYFPELKGTSAETIVSAISSIGVGVGVLIGIFLPEKGSVVGKIMLVMFAVMLMLSGGGAHAAQRLSTQHTRTGEPLPCDLANLLPGCRQAAASEQSAPATNSDQPCDITILTKLTPKNLLPTIKKCISNDNQQLVNDTSRALDSAKNFQPNPDQDGVNCLSPALALFKAGVQIPAVVAQDAVPATATTPAIPAVAAVPAQDPGPVLIAQKYREFVLSGGLTSCQNWVNTPINATIAAGANAVGTATAGLAGAALLAPK